MIGWTRYRAGMAGEMCTGVPRYKYCVQARTTLCHAVNTGSVLGSLGNTRLLFGERMRPQAEDDSERLKEALKIGSRGGVYTNVVSVAGNSYAGNFGKSQQAVHQYIE